jgi:hypothetical protein
MCGYVDGHDHSPDELIIKPETLTAFNAEVKDNENPQLHRAGNCGGLGLVAEGTSPNPINE